MTFLKLIEDNFKEHFPVITKEVAFLNNTEAVESIVIRELQGTIYKNSSIKPMMLTFITYDINETMGLINDFVNENNTTWLVDGLNHIKQNYSTPFVSGVFDENGITVSGSITLTAELIITEDISDIKTLTIDGNVIEFDSIEENYVASDDPQKEYQGQFFKTTMRAAINKLQVTSLQFNNELIQKVRNIRSGTLNDINAIFNIDIVYSDSTKVYSYKMKLGSYSAAYSSANVPFAVLAFTE